MESNCSEKQENVHKEQDHIGKIRYRSDQSLN